MIGTSARRFPEYDTSSPAVGCSRMVVPMPQSVVFVGLDTLVYHKFIKILSSNLANELGHHFLFVGTLITNKLEIKPSENKTACSQGETETAFPVYPMIVFFWD